MSHTERSVFTGLAEIAGQVNAAVEEMTRQHAREKAEWEASRADLLDQIRHWSDAAAAAENEARRLRRILIDQAKAEHIAKAAELLAPDGRRVLDTATYQGRTVEILTRTDDEHTIVAFLDDPYNPTFEVLTEALIEDPS